jgi:hypothetical protein
MTDLGRLFWRLGVQVTQEDAILLSQSAFIAKTLEIFGVQDCKSVSIPLAMSFKKECLSVGNSLDEGENILYQGIFRSLVYAMA